MSMPGAGQPDPGVGHSDPRETAVGAEESARRAQARGGADARPRMNLQQIRSWVDLEIEQAQRRGEFDNLPGAGKPLHGLDRDDPDWWIKGLIEREKLDLSAALPTVMALRQERRGFPESLVGIPDEAAVRERLEDYNARVLEDRRRPVVGPNSPAVAGRVDVHEMVEQWRALRADRDRRLTDQEPAAAVAAETMSRAGGSGPVRSTAVWLTVGLAFLITVALLWAVL